MRLILLTVPVALALACGRDPAAIGADSGSGEGPDGGGDCPGYPAAPHGWNLDDPLALTTFSAIYGPTGAPTDLEVCDLFADHATVKSLVFAIGAPS